MQKYNIIFSVLVLLLVLSGCKDRKGIKINDFESKTGYDYKIMFDFERVKAIYNVWGINSGENYYFTDNICLTEGKSSLRISKKNQFKAFDNQIFQYFAIPFKSNKVVVNIDSKSNNIESAWFKVICFDKNENFLKKDSVSLIGKNEWKTYDLSILSDSISHLYIEISAKSKKGFFSRKSFNVDNLQILCNFHGPITYPDENHKLDMSKAIVIDSIENESFSAIDDLNKHKIISIGETVHGSIECTKIASEITKHQVTNNNCRLVLMEIPFNVGIAINNYITGKSNIDVNKIVLPFKMNVPEFVSLIEWLKGYNSTSKKKVLFFGIDENFILLEKNFLLDLLNDQRKNNKSVINTITQIKKREYRNALNQVVTNNSLYSYDKLTQDVVILGLKVLSHLDNRTSSLDEQRDELMFQISDYAISEMLDNSSTALIYSHLGHSNKLNNYIRRIEIPNYGSLMANKYSDEYFTIALLVGKGTIASGINLKRKSDYKLEIPIDGSLEKLCDESSDSNFYYKVTEDLKTTRGRILGGYYSTIQFSPSSPLKRFDSFIFIKRSNGYIIPKNWPNKPLDYTKMFTNYY